jgi:hypothetical protein
LQQLLDRSALKTQVASRALPLWHFLNLVARRNYRCRMHCRRDVLVASLSAHDPIPDTGMTVDRIGCCPGASGKGGHAATQTSNQSETDVAANHDLRLRVVFWQHILEK